MRKETRCRHIGYYFRLAARVLLYAPSHRQDSTYHGLCYTSRGALVGMRNSSMGSPPPMKDRSDDPLHHERTLLPRSYISLPHKKWMSPSSIRQQTAMFKMANYFLQMAAVICCRLFVSKSNTVTNISLVATLAIPALLKRMLSQSIDLFNGHCGRASSPGPDGAVVMSSDNGLVGSRFTSRYRLQPRAGLLKTQWVGVRPLHPLLSQ